MNHAALKAIVFVGFIAAQANIISAQAAGMAVGGAALAADHKMPAGAGNSISNWAWVKGASITNQHGTYGTPGVPAAGNTPGARYGVVSWTDNSSALWLFGGEGYDNAGSSVYLNDLWKYDPATGNWAWMKGSTNGDQRGTYGTPGVPATANTPGAREWSVSWTDSSGALWLFSGFGFAALGTAGYLNDLWKYDPATGNWTWMKGSSNRDQPGTYGTIGVPAAANTPGARNVAVSWTGADGTLWLFGGDGYPASGSMGKLNDLWKYDPATGNWTWMKGSTNTYQPGTYGTLGMPDPANTPGARWGAASAIDSMGALWLFGGSGRDAAGNNGRLNDLWKYDPAIGDWAWMKGTNTINKPGTYGTPGEPNPANTPGTRVYSTLWTDGSGALWLFGGSGYGSTGSSGFLNDLWKYDPATGNWAWMKGANTTNQHGTYGTQGTADPANTPGARYSTGSWTDRSGALWLFGGAGYAASGGVDYLNDLWKFNLISAPAGVAATDGTYLNKVLITWNALSGATSYEVWRHTSNNSGAASKISSPDPTGTSYDDTSAAAGTTYYYWVKAVNAEGASSFSTSDHGYPGVVGPLVTANGLVGTVSLNSGDAVAIAVQMMNVDPYAGTPVDWWVIAFAYTGQWYYMNNVYQWASFNGDLATCHPVYQGPLGNLPSTPVLSGVLPVGTYGFWFAVDYPRNGVMNGTAMLYNNVTVVVQ